MWLQIILLSFSLSIDALGIGISYAFRKVRIDGRARMAVGVISAVIMGAAVAVGGRLNRALPEAVVSGAGAVLLIVMGLILLYRNLLRGKETEFDKDSSRHVVIREGLILGGALSADSVSAGIAAAATGMNGIILAPAVGLMQAFLLSTGEYMMRKWEFVRRLNRRVCSGISGVLLITIGIARLCA